MSTIVEHYHSQIDQLRKNIRSRKNFDQAISLALDLHAVTHAGNLYANEEPTFYDQLLAGLHDEDFSVMATKQDETIAWHIWHIARIEDLVSNLLIAEQVQIFNDDWMQELHVTIKDTGNVMSDAQIMDFSKQVDKQRLLDYRSAVGKQTRTILKSLSFDDCKRKPDAEYLEQICEEGGLLEAKDSLWLKDFWGRHTIAGLILLPLTRHHMMHLLDSMAIKEFIQAGKTPYLK